MKLLGQPYKFTSDDIFFKVFAQRNNLQKSELLAARKSFFSKGQPCFRSSSLTKKYGWGIHNNNEDKVGMYGVETSEYKKFLDDKALKIVVAMRSKKA